MSGKLRHEARSGELPVVGDWVAARPAPSGGRATIVALLPRRGALVRKRAGHTSEPQLIAANVDCVFLVSSLNQDWNPRRVERTLAMIWEAGAQPVLLLTKLDLCDDPSPQLSAASEVAPGVPVHAVSVLDGRGLDALNAYLTVGRTVALIGSSGVGKSTLVNHLLAEERLATLPIRERDDRGRHATTRRELFALAGGGLLIDTPGMRELGLYDASAGLGMAFEDIEALTGRCRFHDCQHGGQPGCAVAGAIEAGELDAARFAAFLKLKREEAHQARRTDERLAIAHRAQQRAFHKGIRDKLRGNPKH